MKKVLGRYGNDRGHWVGDGFPVRSLFSYDSVGKQVSPFLLLDYAGPHNFEPTDKRRGVGQHPHRGFETVTIVYDGEVEHRDSTGQGGVIGPGDVQWMTAGGGILHEEFEVGLLEPTELPRLVTPMGGAPLLEAFEDHARPAQRRIVAKKKKSFDEERVVVLSGTAVLDGQHHVVAAAQLGKPVRFIDLEAPAPEPSSPGGP